MGVCQYMAHIHYNDTPEDIDIARRVACIIIGDPNFEIRALDARDYIDYCMATHEYERLAVLANDALDLYLKGVISLHEFKLIIAANKKLIKLSAGLYDFP